MPASNRDNLPILWFRRVKIRSLQQLRPRFRPEKLPLSPLQFVVPARGSSLLLPQSKYFTMKQTDFGCVYQTVAVTSPRVCETRLTDVEA